MRSGFGHCRRESDHGGRSRHVDAAANGVAVLSIWSYSAPLLWMAFVVLLARPAIFVAYELTKNQVLVVQVASRNAERKVDR